MAAAAVARQQEAGGQGKRQVAGATCPMVAPVKARVKHKSIFRQFIREENQNARFLLPFSSIFCFSFFFFRVPQIEVDIGDAFPAYV